MQVLKVIPKNVLEAEKFQMLSKTEVEKTAKEWGKPQAAKTIVDECLKILKIERKRRIRALQVF